MSNRKGQMLSAVIPAYNEKGNVKRAYQAIKSILEGEGIPFEIIFIDDGSSDGTYEEIEELSEQEEGVKGLSFSRNFGKEAAIFAGLEAAEGDCCVVLDCDLQHPPETIVKMYRLWEQGYEVVEGVKAGRGKENPLHTLCARCFYAMISRAARVDMSRASDFKLLDRKAVDALLTMPERAPFFRALSSWIGFETASVEFHVAERQEGVSKWSPFMLVRYAVRNITSFTGAPMQFVSLMGWVMFFFSMVLGIQSLYQYFSGNAQEGFTTVIIIQLLVGSMIMISLGVIGHYIARTYDEIKARPRYLIRKRCGIR